MHSTYSVLWTILERARGYTDDTGGKYSDDYLMKHKVMPEFVNVWSRIAQTVSNPILMKFDITLNGTQSQFMLPPHVQEVWALRQYNDNGSLKNDWKPGSPWSSSLGGWRLEGNMLTLDPPPSSGNTDTWTVLYLPSGDFLPHYATDGYVGEVESSLSSDDAVGTEKTFKLSASPALGLLDLRPNAYVGAMLRILNRSTGTQIVEERIIASYDVEDRQLEVTRPWTFHGDAAATITYEIVPAGMQSLAQAVAGRVAISMGVDKNVSAKMMQYLDREYRFALKTVLDNLTHMQMRVPKHYDKSTMDNTESHLWWYGA